MNVAGAPRRSIRLADDGWAVEIIDQTRLPYELATARLETVQDAARAIREMRVRGAPLIGATAAYGVCLALREDPGDAALERACALLLETRPTAVNLRWALDGVRHLLAPVAPGERAARAYAHAAALCDRDVATCRAIGEHALPLVRAAWEAKGGAAPVQVLTHCNAGWLATVDWGTALAPIYLAHDAGIPVHVWVDETRPRNQGLLTAWELGAHGVAHTVVADNAGGHLMRRGLVDLVLVGTDRTTARGDVCNKIGTYLKALAARDAGVPFWVAVPSASIDWDAEADAIPIEERADDELAVVRGLDADGRPAAVRLLPRDTRVANPAFDVTPARLVTGLVTERGRCPATAEGLRSLFPERAA